jgi:hypothetical protein
VMKSWLDGWGWRPWADLLPISHGWQMYASECWNKTITKKYNSRIEIICPRIVSYVVLFMPPLVVVDIFVFIHMQSTSVQVLEPGGCKLGVVTTTLSFLECEVEHWGKLDY